MVWLVGLVVGLVGWLVGSVGWYARKLILRWSCWFGWLVGMVDMVGVAIRNNYLLAAELFPRSCWRCYFAGGRHDRPTCFCRCCCNQNHHHVRAAKKRSKKAMTNKGGRKEGRKKGGTGRRRDDGEEGKVAAARAVAVVAVVVVVVVVLVVPAVDIALLVVVVATGRRRSSRCSVTVMHSPSIFGEMVLERCSRGLGPPSFVQLKGVARNPRSRSPTAIISSSSNAIEPASDIVSAIHWQRRAHFHSIFSRIYFLFIYLFIFLCTCLSTCDSILCVAH